MSLHKALCTPRGPPDPGGRAEVRFLVHLPPKAFDLVLCAARPGVITLAGVTTVS